MSSTAEALKSQLLALGDRERLELAEFLYDSVPEECPDDLDEEYWTEINRRSDEIDAGTAIGRTADEVMADLKARYG